MAEKQAIPLYVVENHNEILHHIYRALGSKKIPFEKGVMLHFDSHPDMGIPENFDSSKIFIKEYVLDAVGIESWIMPAVYAKHFSTIAWIKPPWSLQLTEGIHHFQIGKHISSKEIKLTCPESYFVGDCFWARNEELENCSDVTVEVRTLVNMEEQPKSVHLDCYGDEKLHSFSEQSSEHLLSSETLQQLQETLYVLDIDLDFFSTRNPFLNVFTQEQHKVISEFYHYEHPKDPSNVDLISIASTKRQKQLKDLRSLIHQFMQNEDPCDSSDNSRFTSLLKSVMSMNPSLDLEMVHLTGCNCEDCSLPHFVSTGTEIQQLLAATKKFLEKLPRPSIITISRSSYDDYCPEEDVDFIQESVLAILHDVYHSLDVKLDYEQNNAEQSTSSTIL